MQELFKTRSEKSGLPPGSLVHIGERKLGKSKITLFNYADSFYEEKEIKDISECSQANIKGVVSWVNVEGIHETNVIEKIGNHFGINLLTLEDILNTDQRPKAEDFKDNIFVVFKMLSYTNEIISEQVSFVIGPNFVISFQEGIPGDVFNPTRERIKKKQGQIRKEGADYLLYSLIDAVVDGYFSVLEKVGAKIELLENELVKNPAFDDVEKIYSLKREMIFLRKSVWPLREVLSELQKIESPLVTKSTRMYLRDIYDHTIQIIDTLESFRDVSSGLLEIYLSNITNRTNTVMKVLTIIATIFMPPTFIVGIYGMNFKFMPELEWKLGYPLVMLFILLIAVSMLILFKKKKWF